MKIKRVRSSHLPILSPSNDKIMTKSRSKRRVTFTNDIETIIGISDHSLIVKHSKLWYSVNDIEHLKNDYQNLIHKTRYKLSQQTRCSTEITGLEKYLSAELSEEFKLRKEELYRAIQNECLNSTNGGLPDIDRLASVSRFHTEWARTQATFAAKLLQKDVSRASAATSTKSRSKGLKKRRSSISSKSTASTAVITEDTRSSKAVECQTIGDIKCSSSSQAALASAA